MKHRKKLLLILLISGACSNAVKNEEVNTTELPELSETKPEEPKLLEPVNPTQNLIIKSKEDLKGYWVGFFEPDAAEEDREWVYNWNKSNKINVSIDSLYGDSVLGHSVVAGNRRIFRGTCQLEDNIYRFSVREPGDHKYDGEFEFSIAANDKEIKGKWKAYGKVEISSRTYKLEKKIFAYNPDADLEDAYFDWEKIKTVKEIYEGEEYIDESYLSSTQAIFKYNPSKELLTKKQVENLSKADIFILRNSIYAKHGYSFKKRPLRAYFDNQTWYMPVYTDIKAMLSETEKQNIKLLLSYEKHAEEYYDVFGR